MSSNQSEMKIDDEFEVKETRRVHRGHSKRNKEQLLKHLERKQNEMNFTVDDVINKAREGN